MTTELSLDDILNTTLDDLKPNQPEIPRDGNLVQIKHLGVDIDFHYNLQEALSKAKTSKDYQVYQFTGSNGQKHLVSSTGASTVPGNRPHLKRQHG